MGRGAADYDDLIKYIQLSMSTNKASTAYI